MRRAIEEAAHALKIGGGGNGMGLEMKAQILMLLRERACYVSGQELCRRFGVSRTAVWKAIGQLKREGYVIEAVQNRGYRLIEGTNSDSGEVYGQNELASRMQTVWAGRNLYFYESLGSTNIRAKQLAEEGAPHGTLVVADMQTDGRGRRGRGWESPAGTNIYFTIVLKPTFAPDKASMLTLVMAYAVAKGLEKTLRDYGREASEYELGIKWPNDIVVRSKKICGILTEMSMSVEQSAIQYMVIGVGVNVGEQDFAPEVADKATGLNQECGVHISRGRLLADIMKAFEISYEQFLAQEKLTCFREAYNALLVNRDREICVLEPRGEYRGVAKGIDDAGELLVELPDGSITKVYAGEVSVRGIYGYV